MARSKRPHNRLFAQVALIAGGTAMVALGVHFGEVKVVFMKAVYICLECVGIG